MKGATFMSEFFSIHQIGFIRYSDRDSVELSESTLRQMLIKTDDVRYPTGAPEFRSIRDTSLPLLSISGTQVQLELGSKGRGILKEVIDRNGSR